MRDMYKLSSSYASGGSAAIDLSDATISKLSSKLQAMKDLKASLLSADMAAWLVLRCCAC